MPIDKRMCWEKPDAEWTEDEKQALKNWLKHLLDTGTPVLLLPTMAAAATAKGFEEHVHFEVRGMMPTALEE